MPVVRGTLCRDGDGTFPTPRCLVLEQRAHPDRQSGTRRARARGHDDRSGDRLRDWMGVTEAEFYDRSRVAIVPMAFCFPGYSAAGSDLPPPRICARTWRDRAMAALGQVPLTLLIGGYAQQWHLGGKVPVTTRVAQWRDHAPGVFALPHPSWRNTGWLNRNPWFADKVLPELRARVREVLDD